MCRFKFTDIVPGGIRPSDHCHVETNDRTCSRCRKEIREDEVPVLLWSEDGTRLWIYCNNCDAREPDIWNPAEGDIPRWIDGE